MRTKAAIYHKIVSSFYIFSPRKISSGFDLCHWLVITKFRKSTERVQEVDDKEIEKKKRAKVKTEKFLGIKWSAKKYKRAIRSSAN